MEATYDTYTAAVCATAWPNEYHALPKLERILLQRDVLECASRETYEDGMGISLAEAAKRMARRIRPATLASYTECLVIQSRRESSRPEVL